MKLSFALIALFAGANAVKLNYDGESYPYGSPYSYAEQDNTNQEVAKAWDMIEQNKNEKMLEEYHTITR